MYDSRILIAIKFALLLIIPASLFFCGKIIAIPLLLAATYTYWRIIYRDSNCKYTLILLGIFWLINLQPIDIWFQKTKHGFGIRPVAWGLVGDSSIKEAREGKCIFGGCTIYPNRPKYVITF